MLRGGRVVWFLLPWVVGFVLLTLLPMVGSLGLSFTRVDGQLSTGSISWIGWDHYTEALSVESDYTPTLSDPVSWRVLGGRPSDPDMYKSLGNSLFYTLFAVPLGLLVSLGMALLLSVRMRGQSIVRACVYLPHLLGGAATLVIWSWLLNPQFGWINELIRGGYCLIEPVVVAFGGSSTSSWPVPRWLYSPSWCKPAVILIHVWTVGGSMLIFLAALRRVPSELYDAASLDGAGSGAKFWTVTLPQITPALLFNLIVSVVFTMQSFSEAYMLQTRGQDDGLLFYVLYLYRTAFEAPYRMGYAAALSWIMFGVLVCLVGPLLWTSRRWVHDAIEV